MSDTLLAVEHLTVEFEGDAGSAVAVDDVSFELCRGETLALVGESGAGKSITAYSIVRLLPEAARVRAGRILWLGRDLLALPEREMQRLRGAAMGFIFQEPAAALTPVMRVGDLVAEPLIAHGLARRSEARRRAIDLLGAVSLADPARRAREYAHQLSGGMMQRVMIAAALACSPPLLIADEPTTALDVTVQAQILDLLRRLKAERALSLLLITHDLGVVAELADRVAVMRAGRIVEQGEVRDVLRRPQHPYTQALLAAIPGRVAGGALSDGDAPAGS
jgi:ABC-type dipeptide/oligopeptide/nickel transport system ATPase component